MVVPVYIASGANHPHADPSLQAATMNSRADGSRSHDCVVYTCAAVLRYLASLSACTLVDGHYY